LQKRQSGMAILATRSREIESLKHPVIGHCRPENSAGRFSMIQSR
jgi:hypothetical protein